MKSVFAQRFEDECGDVKVAFKLPDGEKLEHWFPRCSCVFSLLYLHKKKKLTTNFFMHRTCTSFLSVKELLYHFISPLLYHEKLLQLVL